MKGSAAFVAGTFAIAASTVAATPAKIEARQSSTSSGKTPQVTVRGNAFWAGNTRFYIRGVDYQPGGSSDITDPLADTTVCRRDIAEFKKLGINTIRVYTVDNTANHDECMTELANAGIYLALDVNTPKYSINRASPAESYNDVYLQSIFATMDAFANYDNTLLFFSGNEVINDDTNTNCAPYVKAVTRDMKQYRDSRGYRKIPIGYSAADVDSNRYEMATYMNCGTDDQRSDFFAFNDYSWCDPSSSYTISGWDQKVERYGNYSIPLFLSEYGCITGDRQFSEVASLYDQKMTGVYSGGLVYEYSEEESGYGLVNINGGSITEKDDFAALSSALAAAPAPTGDGGYNANGAASECPVESDTWEVEEFTGSALPAIPSGAVKYMDDGAGTGPGLTGDGSQNAGGSSSGTASAGSGQATVTATPSASASGSSSGSSSASGAAASSTQSGAASSVARTGDFSVLPFVFTAVVAASTLFGAALL